MPTYVYRDCGWCGDGEEFEKNVPISERDNQWCEGCGVLLKRLIRFSGRVWAPTAGGTR